MTALRNCLLVAAFSAIAAQAAPYTFSFSASTGLVTGTVSGTLDLPFITPGGSGTGAADSVVLTSFPAGFGTLTEGTTVTSWTDQVENSFTVVSGVITAVDFFAATGGSDPADLLCINSTTPQGSVGGFGCPTTDNELHTGVLLYGYNLNGLAGVTFTPTSSSAPEPGTLLLLGSGLAGVFGISRRKNFLRANTRARQ